MAKRDPLTKLSWLLVACCAGCGSTRVTDTSRTGLEQILISNAIDRSLDEFDLTMVNGYRIFVDEKNLECLDKKYVVGSLRRRLLAHGGQLVDKLEDAAIVVEIHSGAVGTDRSEGFLGIPASNIPGPVPVRTPEIKLLSQQTQYGSAKLSLVAYDAKTRHSLGQGGVSLARSNNSSWSVFGIGPFSSGSIPNELATASQEKATTSLKRRVGLGGDPRGARPKIALVEPGLLSPPAFADATPKPATIAPPVAANAPPLNPPWVFPAGAQMPAFLPTAAAPQSLPPAERR